MTFAGGIVPASAKAPDEGTATDPRAPTERIAGRYELEGLLGQGGMGMVYRARDLELGEYVAIKMLAPTLVEDPQNVDRLKTEILTTRKISHPNVIRLHDFGLAGRDPFISMELLEGGTLADRLEDGLLPIGQAVEIAIGIVEGLAAAHALGIVHRDVKPQNVLFDGTGRPKIVDFGLARLASAARGNTVAGLTGTPFYMSPEQMTGGRISPSSDLYSLGVLLFEMFTGTLPFEGKNLSVLAEQHCNVAPPRPCARRADLPPEIESLILRLLQKEPTSRYLGAAQLLVDLRALQVPRPGRVKEAGAIPGGGSSPTQPTLLTVRPPHEEPTALHPPKAAAMAIPPAQRGSAVPRSKRRSGAARIALVSLSVAGAAAFVFALSTARRDAAPAPSIAAATPAMPTASPVATATVPRPLAIASSRPVAPLSPRPRPTLETTPAPTLARTPLPPSPPPRDGRLTVRGGPFITYRREGKLELFSKQSPLRNAPLSAGEHVLVFRCGSGRSVEHTVRIAPEETTSLRIDCGAGVVSQEPPG